MHPWLKTRDAAILLDCSPDDVVAMCQRQKFPARKAGPRRWEVEAKAVLDEVRRRKLQKRKGTK